MARSRSTLLGLLAFAAACALPARAEDDASSALTRQLSELVRGSERALDAGRGPEALGLLEQAHDMASAAQRPEARQIEARMQRVKLALAARPGEAVELGAPPRPAGAMAAPALAAQSGLKLSLEECVEIAIQNNLGLRLDRVRDQQSDLDVRSAWARYLPTFNASLQHQGGQSAGSHFNSTTLSGGITQRAPWGTSVTVEGHETEDRPATKYGGRYSGYGVSVTHPLWKGFGEDVGMYEIRTARLGRLVSRGSLELGLQETIFEVKNAYADCVRQLQTKEVNERAVESAATFLKLTQAREKAGAQTMLDVYNAEVQLADRQLALTTNQRALESAFDALKRLMDVDLDEVIAVEVDSVDFGEAAAAGEEQTIEADEQAGTVALVTRRGGQLVGTPAAMFQARRFEEDKVLSEAIANRIDLLNSKRAVALQHLTAVFKKDGLGHQIDLALGYERNGSGPNWSNSHGFEDHSYSAALLFSVPWGKVSDKAAYEKALLEIQRAELELKQARTAVHADVRVLLRTLRENEKSILIQAKKVEQAKRLVAAERIRFERGLKDSFDVITAEDNLLKAKTDFITRKVGYVVLLAQLELAVGKPTGRVDLSAETPGGAINSTLPGSLKAVPKSAPTIDSKTDDKY